MKPRKNYRSRPKKTGAKKRQKVKSQIRRLEAAGHDKDKLEKMTTTGVRELLKEKPKTAKKATKPVKLVKKKIIESKKKPTEVKKKPVASKKKS